MTVYEHRTSLLIQSGSSATTSLKVKGGLLRQVIIHAMTDSTVFRAHLGDSHDLCRLEWGFHTGELSENAIAMPMVGAYTLTILNASQVDTVEILLAVQED